MILAGGYIVRAWKSAIAQSAGIRRLLKGQVRRLQILVLQIRGEIVGHHNRVVSLIEVRQIPSVFVEAGQNRPAKAITQREPARDLEFVLTEKAILPCRSGHVRAGDRKENIRGQPLQKVAERVAGEDGLAGGIGKGELAEIIRRQDSLNIGIRSEEHTSE